jgi:hypothetical protein
MDSNLHSGETQFKTNNVHCNHSHPPRAVITRRNKTEFKRKRETEEDVILKKASAAVNKVNSTDDLNVFGEFVASELRGLCNDSVRKTAKRNIQRILLDAGIEDDNVSMDLNAHSSCCMDTALSVSL